MVFFALLLFS